MLLRREKASLFSHRLTNTFRRGRPFVHSVCAMVVGIYLVQISELPLKGN